VSFAGLEAPDEKGIPATPTLDGREFGMFAHDWRLEPRERWRNRQVDLEPYGTE
jgi:hypothetical protein